jgi:hypothetical protein
MARGGSAASASIRPRRRGQAAARQRPGAVGALRGPTPRPGAGGQVVLQGQVGGAPGGGQVGPAGGPGPGQPGVRLRAQAERALAERPADRQHAGLHQQVDQQRQLVVGQVQLAGQAAQVADGDRAGADQRQRLAVQPGADALGGDHRAGGGRGGERQPVGHRVERLGGRRRRPLGEDQAAAERQRGLPGDHELVVGDRQQQAAREQPARRLGVRVAGEAAVADPHDGDRAGRGEGLVEQPAHVGAGRLQRPRDHLRVGEGGAHGPDQRRLAGGPAGAGGGLAPGRAAGRLAARGRRDAEVGQDALELLGADPDLGQLGHWRPETAGPAERRRQPRRPGDDAVAARQGDAERGQGTQAGPQAAPVQTGAGRLGQRVHGGRQADDRQQLGEPQRAQVEGAQGGRQRGRAAGTAGELGERRRRGAGEQVGAAFQQADEVGVGERREGGGVAGQGVPPPKRARAGAGSPGGEPEPPRVPPLGGVEPGAPPGRYPMRTRRRNASAVSVKVSAQNRVAAITPLVIAALALPSPTAT